jgi:rhamnose utilization protein RhaD (predicted bifunctional aldolase and dehydrogenase)
MRIRTWPADLDYFSSLIGKNIFMVQGPGGNTSYKNEETMWIKASGTRLADALTDEIFTGVDVKSGNSLENIDQLRPSIEKDFHLLIPFPYVVHTHSLRSISFAIENDFGSIAIEYPEIAFVSYARPGAEIYKLLKESLDFDRHKAAILQNHGFLTWGETMEQAYNSLISFESNYLDSDLMEEVNFSGQNYLNHPNAITPDYAVFLSTESEEEILNFTDKNLWKKQMYLVSQKAARAVNQDKGINYLNSDEVHILQNWESEKYRMASNK